MNILVLLLMHTVSHGKAKSLVHSTYPDSECGGISRPEVMDLLRKLETSVGASVNVRLLSLEEEVSKLSNTVRTLKEQCRNFSSNCIQKSHRKHHTYSRPSSSSHSSYKGPLSHKVHNASSNSLLFRVVWGTPRSCSSQVVRKALCALLPITTHASITVKGSFRQRGSRSVWWYTIMAPIAVMQQIVAVWHFLEAKTSWKLRSSLNTHPRSLAMGQQSLYISQRGTNIGLVDSSSSFPTLNVPTSTPPVHKDNSNTLPNGSIVEHDTQGSNPSSLPPMDTSIHGSSPDLFLTRCTPLSLRWLLKKPFQ